nr:hypothetical protein L204_05451 [Cryptococcus depauperatus CBS 7855]
MRSGIAPFGGARGASLVVTKLSDDSWSAPTSLSSNILSVVSLLGADVHDFVLVIRDQKALESSRLARLLSVLNWVSRRDSTVEVQQLKPGWKKLLFGYMRRRGTLKDAESGKAQSEKGDTLDIIVPEGATEFELHNEEVLKLPSTPDMINGREQGSDLETEVARHPS